MRFLISFLLLFLAISASAQKWIVGVVKDGHSAEPVPYASVRFAVQPSGQSTDSAGYFSILLRNVWDSVVVSSVGYEDYKYFVQRDSIRGDTLRLLIPLQPGKLNAEVVVKAKVNRGLWLWKRMVREKPNNNPFRFRNFSYELYNKLQLDIKNVNRKIGATSLMRPFAFVFDNIDTSEGAAVLPAYLSEALSRYYYQRDPLKRREEILAVKTIGVQNESASRLLGGMDQVVNVYSNFIPVFDKQFVSPLSDRGDQYYHYKVADTQYLAGKRIVHFYFTPKRKGENTFEGDGWVNDTTFAIQKLNLRLRKDANVNFVERLSLIQEYVWRDSLWLLAKDKFVVDISPLSKKALSFVGRKTTTYRDMIVNDTAVTAALMRNKKVEEVVLVPSAMQTPDSAWSSLRHEELSTVEQGIYRMVDTLTHLPAFKKAARIINFVSTGYWNFKTLTIGPWQNWATGNVVEGARFRFDLATNIGFDNHWILHAYAAYGTQDKKWKGAFDAMYLFQRSPRRYLYGSFINDFDYGQNYYDEVSADNIFALAVRKKGVPIKFIKLREYRLDAFNEWRNGFSATLSGKHRAFDPVLNLPPKTFLPGTPSVNFTSFEISVRLRFAHLEKFLENNFYRTSLGSPFPIAEIRYTKGLSGVLGSGWDYHRFTGSVSNTKKIAPLGTIYYNVFGGQTFGTLPYVFLDIAPGNELHYYNRNAFNMMNRYEFVHDRYAGVNVEHNFGSGIFKYLPITRKLGFRQFWQAKALRGRLSPENAALNFRGDHPFQTLNSRTYVELGTGVDNILRVLRLDLVWRVAPATSPKAIAGKNFGVFGSFRFSF